MNREKAQFMILGLTVFLGSCSAATTDNYIPIQFVGKWGDNKCINGSNVNMDEEGSPIVEVSSKYLHSMDLSCDFIKVIKTDASTFTGKFNCGIEGESIQTDITLTLKNGTLYYDPGIEGLGLGLSNGKNLQRCK